MASDFEINGQVNIDYSAFDKMSKAAERSYRNAIQPFDRMTSKFAQFEQTLNQVSKTSGRTLAQLSGFGNLSTDFLVAANAANQLDKSLKSLNGTDKARLRTANQVAAELGGRNYANLSSEIDRRLSPDYRPTRQTVDGGTVIDFSSREKNLAIVASMTAKAAAEDKKFAEEEAALAIKLKETNSELYRGSRAKFDADIKAREKFVQGELRQRMTAAFGGPISEMTPEAAALQRALTGLKLDQLFAGAEGDLVKFANHLPRIRYALYDVAASATATGVALSAMAIAPAVFAIKAERSFADVVRTSKLSGDEIFKLRKQFIDLQQTIPESFSEITKIGSLAGQLNIAKESLTSFTKSVAMFSATTNVNVQDAATAFGRLDQLINGINGRYEALGSSILAVGVNSVATESQIIAIAQQIASIANLAKFSADQVIGLSGALASVGTSPELSRGIVTRLFGNIQTALAENGEALKKFGAVSGQSAEDFKNSWNVSAASQLLRFLKGINEDGAGAENTLRDLGIASIRDIPAILKLAQGWRDVAESFRIARDGFINNSELQKQYGIITETISDKIQILVNNFQAFMSAVGGASSVLIPAIQLLSDFIRTLTDIVQNPFGQWAAGLFSSVSLLGGGLLLLGGGAAFGAARLTAIAQAALDFLGMQGLLTEGMKVTNMTFREYSKAVGGAIVQTKLFRTALMSIGITAAVVVGLTAIAAASEAITEAMKSAGEKAREYFNNADLSQAINADTEALRQGVLAYDYVLVAQDKNLQGLSDRRNALRGATETEKAFQEELLKTTGYVDVQTKAFGENYAAILTDEFIKKADQDKYSPIRKLFEDPKLFESFKKTGLTALEVVTTTIRDGLPAAQQRINEAFNQLDLEAGIEDKQRTMVQKMASARFGGGSRSQTDTAQVAAGARTAFDELAIAVENLTEEEKRTIEYERALGAAIAESRSEVEIATEKLKEYKDAVANAFLDTNTVSDFADSFTKLAEDIGKSGNSFSSFSKAGRTNLANFQDSVAKAIRAGESLGIDATEAVAALFVSLQAQGIDTANLLAQVSSMNIAGFDPSRLGILMNSSAFNDVAASFDGIVKSANDAGASVGGVAEKVRTLVDYANDLSSVYSRAFDIRFSAQSTLDDITSSFQKIAKATADAVSEIQDLNAEISKLTADKALKEYFLSVAEAYGDTLRAAQLRAEIADIDSNLAKKANDLSKAQAKSNKTLSGSSEEAIANRAEILALVKSYQDHIKALASSGMSQEDLAATTEQLRQDFITQATQLGYNTNELGIYAAAFDDVAYAINNIPRDITVEIDANPAVTALNEIRDAANSAGSAVSNINNQMPDFDSLVARKAALQAQINAAIAYMKFLQDSGNATGAIRYSDILGELAGRMRRGEYYNGGYTGAGGKYQIAGVVHRGEYVVPKEQVNQATGTPYFMQQMPKFFTGGYVGGTSAGSTMMVELSPIDRQLLAQAGNVQLTIDGRVIAGATNSANYVSALRGSN